MTVRRPSGFIAPCLLSKVAWPPSGRSGVHEIKHDGYRFMVCRENDRVRLLTRNGHDWTSRCPWIVESALKNRQKHFVIDGEAVVLGVDGNADSSGVYS